MQPVSQLRNDIDAKSPSLADSAERIRQNSRINAPVLNSWKEIAAYLGRGVRTVQRWERHFDMPVHRTAGRYHSSVLAFPAELDNWLHQLPRAPKDGDGSGDELSELAPLLLQHACDLLAQGERFAATNRRRLPEAEKAIGAIRQIVQELTSCVANVTFAPPKLKNNGDGAKPNSARR